MSEAAEVVGQLVNWGDDQQYDAEPHSNYQGPGKGVLPTVKVISMTEDPLGVVAAMNAMYSGRVVRDLRELTVDDRIKALEDVQQTHLKAPLESIKIHMLVEGVDRAFTHQQVRQRTAVFAQESLRFAVPGRLDQATTLPPSLMDRSEDGSGVYPSKVAKWREMWFNAIDTIDAAYHGLVGSGMPAEEARGLLPHCVATRDHWITDMRNLSDHAGNRLCTQAQFHWRLVFAEVLRAIMDFGEKSNADCTFCHGTGSGETGVEYMGQRETMDCYDCHAWQFRAIAESGLFRPVCYQVGHCPFKASFDRACSIRDRVDNFAREGVPSSEWDRDIDRREWLMNPDAARVRRREEGQS